MAKEQDFRYIRTNQLLINAFTELLSIKKFEDITVNELCDKALIRRATFYTHFLDKYDFFAYFIRHHSDRFMDKIQAEDLSNANEFLICMSQQLISYLNEHMTLVQNALNSNAFPILLSILTQQINEDLTKELSVHQSSFTEDDVSMEVLIAFYSGGFIQIISDWLNHKNRMSQDELTEQIKKLFKMHPLESPKE